MSNGREQEFQLRTEQPEADPHEFRFVDHEPDSDLDWPEIADTLLNAWRITANAFFEAEDTGFETDGISSRLNQFGADRLPETPTEDQDVTKEVCVTDYTEVVASRYLNSQFEHISFPYLRVLHKGLPTGVQHNGIDIIGYQEVDRGKHRLVVAEVMASVADTSPPSTVTDHRKQLLDETLQPRPPKRLLRDLQTAHDEATDPEARTVLNGFIAALASDKLFTRKHLGIGVLVRPSDAASTSDWNPFYNRRSEFEDATIPTELHFGLIECDEQFSSLIERVKNTVTA